MKTVIAIAILLMIFSFAGCSQVDKWTLQASKANLDGAKVQRQVADEVMSTWSLQSGEIQCGADELMPVGTLKDIQRLDQIVKDSGKWVEADFQRGCFLGLGLKLTAKQVEDLVNKLIPLITKAMGV